MNYIRALASVCRNQAKNIFNLLHARRASFPSLGSMTLDLDDVGIAKKWLNSREQWDDRNIIQQYESEFAAWNGSRFAFAFMGGRVGLSACIHALDLKPGDEVIVPGYTCVVVPNAFQYAGVKPVYADIELETYGLDAERVEERISTKTRAILIHHLYGLVCRDIEPLLDIAKRKGLRVIEDCAHSTGALYKRRKVGNFGDAAFYSSEQSKIFNTIQGGITVTNDNSIANRIREYSASAPFPDRISVDRQLHNVILNYYRYKHPNKWWRSDAAILRYAAKEIISTTPEEVCGIRPCHYGRRMPAPIAALAINQLYKIDHYNQLRRCTATIWDLWCNQHSYGKPYVHPESTPVFLRYPVMVEEQKKRNRQWARKSLGVDLGVWFISNIHPAGLRVDGCPNSNRAVAQCINFPTLLR